MLPIVNPLRDGWKLQSAAPGGLDASQVSCAGYDASAWLDVRVPGDVNSALIAAGNVPDYRFGDNAREMFWITAKDWCWRVEFDTPDEFPCADTRLHLDGVDGTAEIWLNGKKLGDAVNAFFPYRFRLDGLLRNDGTPNVLVALFPSLDGQLGSPRTSESRGWGHERMHLRKAQFNHGWDWAIPLPGIGFSDDVSLVNDEGVFVKHVFFQPYCSGRVDAFYMLSDAAKQKGEHVEVRVRIHGHGFDETRRIKAGATVSELFDGQEANEEEEAERIHTISRKEYLSFDIPDPKLWWPRDYGEPNLYNYEVTLLRDGAPIDRKAGRFGIREVEVREEPFVQPSDGRMGMSWNILVNGEKVFCKGANWVPLEMYPSDVTDERLRFHVEKALDVNYNMLRIWGGGVYETDLFYELCDELGILVWQDFMNAGTIPNYVDQRKSIIAECEYQVRRLRNHACIAMWCGTNEHAFWSGVPEDNWQPGEPEPWERSDEEASRAAEAYWGDPEPGQARGRWQRKRTDVEMYNYLLRGLVGRLHPGMPYVESSPESHEDNSNDNHSGNSHNSSWKFGLFDVGGDSTRFREYFDEICSFDSEFCIQGPSSVATLKKFLPADHLWPPDDVWVFHIQKGHANLPHHQQVMMLAQPLFGEIGDLQTFVKYGQALHAELMRAEHETARRDFPMNGGTLVWMYGDCWPTSTWAIIDYYRNPKPSYYAAKRACDKHRPIIAERLGSIEFFFSNNARDTAKVALTYGQESLDGEEVWSKDATLEVGNAAEKFFTMPRSEFGDDPAQYLFIEATVDGETLPKVTYFPNLWRNVEWPEPAIKAEVVAQTERDGAWVAEVKVTTDAYARFCHLYIEGRDAAWFSDNYFDLPAGETRTIRVTSSAKIDPVALRTGHWGTEWL